MSMPHTCRCGICQREMDEFFSTAAPSTAELTSADYEDVLADHRRLVRELDVLLNGDSAAKQASLCDIVCQVQAEPRQLVRCSQLQALLSLGIEICEREAEITFESNKHFIGAHAGQVVDYDARRELAGYKRFIRMAKRMQR